MQKTFTAYNDPAHGWIKVPRTLLKELGIADKVSDYSYQRGGDVYLEEDGDATLFIRTFVGRHGFEPRFIDKYTNNSSKIRNYENYKYYTEAEETELANLKTRMLGFKHWNPKAKRQIENAGLDSLRYWQGVYGF